MEGITLQNTSDRHISLPSFPSCTQEILIPLAAILLEYPVAYVPTSVDQAVFLSGQSLNIYQCLLVDVAGGAVAADQYTLMRFSCPSNVGIEDAQLSPHKLAERLEERFSPRLRKVNCHLILDILTSTKAFDRVAL